MIFPDLLDQFSQELHKEFQNIFKTCLKNQNHFGDLLIWRENGWYNEYLEKVLPNNGRKFSPYVIGPGSEGHSEYTHFEFINEYRQSNVVDFSLNDYLESIKYTPEKREAIDKLVSYESTSIQIEMLIYLKFWEADLIIKKLYELTRIISGESYDWNFRINETNRDNNGTGTRQEIIRKKVRTKVKAESPLLSNWITKMYKTQIRNSIAHSNYSMLGRNIQLNNYIKEDPASQLHKISFDDWHEIFHRLLILHNEMIWLSHAIHDYYKEKILTGHEIKILITKENGEQFENQLELRKNNDTWGFKTN
jgi:hypothetical protein